MLEEGGVGEEGKQQRRVVELARKTTSFVGRLAGCAVLRR